MQVLFILPGATRLRVCVSGTCVQIIRSQQYVVVIVVVIKIVFVTDFTFVCYFHFILFHFRPFSLKWTLQRKLGRLYKSEALNFRCKLKLSCY